MPDVQLTWLGHATFRFDTPGGKRVYVDPWLGNPKCPDSEKEPERVDLIAITHGHSDHVGNTLDLAKKHGCDVVAHHRDPRLALRAGARGERRALARTRAAPSTSTASRSRSRTRSTRRARTTAPISARPTGLVIEVENGTKLYFAGDTCVFGDMQLIARIYEPDVAILPIGDHFTMGPREAAVALELLGVSRCVPCHYGTFPLLHGTPAELRELAPGVEILEPAPGETVEV